MNVFDYKNTLLFLKDEYALNMCQFNSGSGCQTDPNNYRPIFVLPVLSKIFEKVTLNVLVYLSKHSMVLEKEYQNSMQSKII